MSPDFIKTDNTRFNFQTLDSLLYLTVILRTLMEMIVQRIDHFEKYK